MWQHLKELYAYREMLRNLVARELQARYKGSVLGFLWTFANPLLMLIVYSLVFSFAMRVQIENYALFVFVALLPWNYLQSSVTMGVASLIRNAELVKKIYFPREVLPLSIVFANLINYLLSLVILILALLFFNIKFTAALWAFPLIVLVQTLLIIGLTLLACVANVYFRDLEHISAVLMTAWFFLTPVIYPESLIPSHLKFIFDLNPAAWLMKAYRDIFFYGRFPDWSRLAVLTVGILMFLTLSMTIFYLKRNVAEEI